jgi:HD-GYP domain-containing protein (c-di-GMP phosphodiesterase class II)
MWEIAQAAAMHDFGKIGVPNEILSKPDKLTEEEFAIVRQHPAIAAVVLQHLVYPNDWVSVVYHHHEWYNGEGYPAHRAGDDIPLGSRVIAVADAFDAMISDRPYRKAMSTAEAERELIACAGSQFDPEVVNAFRRAKRKGKLRPN